MKTRLFTLFFLTLTFCVYSQYSQEEYEEYSIICHFGPTDPPPTITPPPPPPPPIEHSGSIDPADYQNADPIVINVKFWKINGPNGEFYNDFSETHLLSGIQQLNLSYNQFNIFFKYRGWDEFNSPDDVEDKRWVDIDDDGDYECILYPSGPDPEGYSILSRCKIGEMFYFAHTNGYDDDDMMNIYVSSWNAGFGAAASGLGTNQLVVPSISYVDDYRLVHEMGHCLGLKHTWSEWEHVTRDPNDSNFNALTAGDKILDTAANSGFYNSDNCSGNGNDPDCYPWITQDCEYSDESNEQDDSTPPEYYKVGINHEDVINVMGDAYTCNDNYISPGQGIYMREYLEQDPDLLAIKTTIASLYEPYEGEYYLAGSYNPSLHNPRFQPGFDYDFVECSGDYPAPSDYEDTSFSYNTNNVLLSVDKQSLDYHSMVHPNHSAIYIKHETGDNEIFPQPRKCYDNDNRKPTGGLIIKFNDGVLNTNVTLTPQDSTAINNPNLIQNLESGLYKIEKIYNDGETEENLLQKGNN